MYAAGDELHEGTIVGSYRIDGPLAEGGMGAVYAASHLVLPRRAAVKVLHASMVGRRSAVERTLQEAQIMETIAGPSVVQIYDAGVLPDGRPWVAMELVEGRTLADLLAERGRLPALEVANVLLAVAEALGAAHAQGVYHRDIKPDNILSSPSGVKLIDWGIAHVATAPRLTGVDTAPGTPQYMSPEQVYGTPIDGRTDVYALGVVAYELLVGAPPFRCSNAVESAVRHVTTPPARIGKLAQVPPELDDLVLRMRAREPADRPTVAQLCERLTALIAQLSDGDFVESIDIEVDDLVDTSVIDASLADCEYATTQRIKWTPVGHDRRGMISASDAADVHGEIVVGGATGGA
ncbi:MAG: serine/threonine protein kinase [Deltaproteobacteria bacterium]|nr:serine/threonine protein kinase [Deltaproteobacteria bacterium]MCW5802223.1 serine/threonine protein kinase [Deltaproteobacteria bacterium]